MDIRTILIVGHLVGLVVGLGAATIADILFMNCLLKNRMSSDQYKFLKLVTDVVVAGLGILLVTGFGFILLYKFTDPNLIMNPKMWGKVAIVFVLTLNGLAMHEFILPLFEHNLNRPLFSVPRIRRNKFFLFACGGVSFTAWYSAMILGVWKQANFAFSAQQIFLTYLAIAAVAVLTTPLVAKIVISLAEHFSSGLVHQLLAGQTVWGMKDDGQDLGSCYGLVRKELRRANRSSEAITMVTVTVTGFEQLIESIGPHSSEHLVNNLAQQLHGSLRDNDHLCLLGSARFLVVLPRTDEESSKKVTQRLARSLDRFAVDIADEMKIRGLSFVLKVATTRPTQDVSPEQVIEQIEAQDPLREHLRLAS